MKVFLDTNVLVSAFATRGLSADVFRLVLVEHAFVTGEVVLEEFERVLSSKFKVPDSVIEDLLNLLRRYHVEPKPETLIPLPESDPDDQWILISAVSVEADVLITGESDLLDLTTEVHKPAILSPRDFWNLICDKSITRDT